MVLIHHGARADALRLVGVTQRREGLVVVRRRDAGNHGRFRVPAQRVFEQPREDRVAVRHDGVPGALAPIGFGVGERGNDAPESGQGFVDVAALAEACASRLGGFGALGAGEVDETDAGAALGGLVRLHVVVDLLEHDGEDGMGAGGRVVHFGRGGGARGVAALHVAQNLGDAADRHFGQIFDIGAFGGRLANLEVVWGLVGHDGDQQVAHVLVVDFEVGDAHAVADIGGLELRGSNALKEVLAGAWDEAGLVGRAHHGVGFAGSSLAICENAGVVALEVVVEELLAEAVVDIVLVGVVRVLEVVAPEGVVESEVLLFDDFACFGLSVGWVVVVGHEQCCDLADGVHVDQALGSTLDF